MPEDKRTERFRLIALAHFDAAFNLARWLVRQPEDAEDVVQEALLRAFRSFDGCREATARAWLLRIVRNTAFDWLAARRGRPVDGFADVDPLDPDGTAFVADAFSEPADDPERRLIREDDRRRVNALIAGLPFGFREVVILRELEDMSYKEIAEIVGIPIGTVMSRLARARDLMQKAWSNQDG